MTTQTLVLFSFVIMSGTVMSIMLKLLSDYNMYLMYGLAVLISSIVSLSIRWFGTKWSGWFEFHRGMIVLWLAFAGMNLWYTALYGQGINLAYVPIIVTGGMAILLAVAWWRWFGETISWQFVIGALIILVGMGIMVYR